MSCIPSDRLVVRQSDSERDVLRSQLEHLQQQHNSLLQQSDQLRAEVSRHDSGSVSDVVSPGTLTMVPPVLQHHDRVLNSDMPYSGRILRPTFSRRSIVRNLNWSALSSAWDLWGDDTAPNYVSQAFFIPVNFDVNAYRSLVDTFFDIYRSSTVHHSPQST